MTIVQSSKTCLSDAAAFVVLLNLTVKLTDSNLPGLS